MELLFNETEDFLKKIRKIEISLKKKIRIHLKNSLLVFEMYEQLLHHFFLTLKIFALI